MAHCTLNKTLRRRTAIIIRNSKKSMGKLNPTNFSYREDKNLDAFGEIDFDRNTVRVNPAKGDVVDTIIHEEIHRMNPDMNEKKVRAQAKAMISGMGLKEQANVILAFLRRSKRSQLAKRKKK